MSIYYFNITYRCNSRCMFCAADIPINSSCHEMQIEDFRNELDKENVGENDRVIVNGGEPTLHKDFFLFLDEIYKRGAKIDLYSNGMRFQDENFSKQVLHYENIHVRIPLFGANADFHDALTGCNGSFVAVTTGLDHLCKHIQRPATLEIKMLLSRATITQNEKIYELICSRWKNSQVNISLNPLLISETVIKKKELFIETYSRMMELSCELLEKAYGRSPQLSLGLIPFCVYPKEDLFHKYNHTLRERKKTYYYSDPMRKGNKENRFDLDGCNACIYKGTCPEFPMSYLQYFGIDEIKPISGE